MQLTCRHEVTDFDAWKILFTADDEACSNANVTALKVLKNVDSTAHAMFLFGTDDRDKVQEWGDHLNTLQGEAANTIPCARAINIEPAK